MKQLPLLAFALLTPAVLFSQTPKVKSTWETCWKPLDSLGTKQEKARASYLSNTLTTFDANGNKTMEKQFSPDSVPGRTQTYEYDANNRLVLEKYSTRNGNLTRETQSVFEYNGDGRLIKRTDSLGPKTGATTTYEYDKDGNLAGEVKADLSTQQPSMKVLYFYTGGVKISQELYSYEFLKPTSALFSKTHYNAKGQETQYQAFRDGSMYLYIDYTWNEKGLPAERKEYTVPNANSGGPGSGSLAPVLLKTERFEYMYDIHGNWTKRIMFVNGRAVMIHQRAITYY